MRTTAVQWLPAYIARAHVPAEFTDLSYAVLAVFIFEMGSATRLTPLVGVAGLPSLCYARLSGLRIARADIFSVNTLVCYDPGMSHWTTV